MDSQAQYQEDARLLSTSTSTSPYTPQTTFSSYEDDNESHSSVDIHRVPSASSKLSEKDEDPDTIALERRGPKFNGEVQEVSGLGLGSDLRQSIIELSRWLRFLDFVTTWWLIELLSFIGSAASLAMIVIILLRYNRRPQPSWPHNITINSVLSWFTTLYKVNLLVPITSCISQATWIHYHSNPHPLKDIGVYDYASRGPMGSLFLLWNLRAKRYLVSIGALITILALGVDPIVQQTISIRAHAVNIATQATLGRAQSFLLVPQEAGDESLPVPDMMSTMFAGMFSDGKMTNTTTFDVNTTCQTGNCTFDDFQSLAVCSACEDISTLLSSTCFLVDTTSEYGQIIPYCKFVLPNGLEMNRSAHDYGRPASFGSSAQKKLVTDMHRNDSIMEFTIIRAPSPDAYLKQYQYQWSKDRVREYAIKYQEHLKQNVSAIQCVLHWCVNTYHAKIRVGRLVEQTMNTWYRSATEGLQSDAPDESHSYDLIPKTVETNQSAMRYVVAKDASNALKYWLEDKFTRSTSIAVEFEKPQYVEPVALLFSSQEMARLLRDEEMGSVFANLAKSMTRYIRNIPADVQAQGNTESTWNVTGISPAIGTTSSLEVHVDVQWQWIAFPMALLMSTMLFFGITVRRSTQRKLAVWKSSPLPIVFRGVQEPQNFMSNKVVLMEEFASQVDVRLAESHEGLRLMTERRPNTSVESKQNG